MMSQTLKSLGYFIKQTEKIAFVRLSCDRNIHDAISTGKIPKNTGLRLFPVKMTVLTFRSKHRDTQAVFDLLSRNSVLTEIQTP